MSLCIHSRVDPMDNISRQSPESHCPARNVEGEDCGANIELDISPAIQRSEDPIDLPKNMSDVPETYKDLSDLNQLLSVDHSKPVSNSLGMEGSTILTLTSTRPY